MVENASNYDSFRECLSAFLIEQVAPAPSKPARRKKAARKRGGSNAQHATSSSAGSLDTDRDEAGETTPENDAGDLAEFVEYLADEIFNSLPGALRSLTFSDIKNDEDVAARYSAPVPFSTVESITPLIPATALDSLEAYGLVSLSAGQDVQRVFIQPLLTAYSTSVASPPANLGPEFGSRPSDCEICGRDWIPLTYHHLIPRGVHARVLKRGWHEEWRLNSVAWLCRACHSMVHRIASNEELAKELYSVELLMEREDVRVFAKWVSGVRWKKR